MKAQAKTQAKTPLIPVVLKSTAADPVTYAQSVPVIEEIKVAVESDKAATYHTRNAAKLAVATDCLNIVDATARIKAIFEMYQGLLPKQSMREQFHAVVELLVRAADVTLVASKSAGIVKGPGDVDILKTDGTVGFLKADEGPSKAQAVQVLKPVQAVDLLGVADLKNAATASRRSNDTGRKERVPAIKPHLRAPFADELAGYAGDRGMAPKMAAWIAAAASDHPAFAADLREAMKKEAKPA